MPRRSIKSSGGRERAFDVLSIMRHETLSLTKAAKRVGTSPRTVFRYAAAAFERRRGRYYAKPTDHLQRRVMPVLTPQGLQTVTAGGSRSASRIGAYWNAVGRFLEGDTGQLANFTGVTVDGVEFETDPDAIESFYEEHGHIDFQEYYEP